MEKVPDNLPARAFYKSPVGWLKIEATGSAVTSVWFLDAPPETGEVPNDLTRETQKQLEAYFQDNRTHFDLPLFLSGTDFQEKVWRALAQIPYGRTISYLAFARMIGDAKATRAVGYANGCNPLPIILPCHRVIGSDGSLTGFGGGLWRKKWLLQHEGSWAEQGSLF